MPRTNIVNAVDVALAGTVGALDTEIIVDDALPLPPVPFYLVVDPFNDTQGREYMLCTAVAVNVLTVTRSLAGSDSDVHDSGDIVRITIAAQHIDDLWTDIEAIPPQTFLHADLSDVGALPSAHHARYADPEAVSAMGLVDNANPLNHLRYTDTEAIAAVGTIPPPQTFLHTDLTDVSADQHHIKYTDAEAIAAVGPHTPAQTFLHADLTDAASLPSAHHTRYTDSEAVAAVGPIPPDPAGVYLPLIGGVLTGDLGITGAKFNITSAGGALIELWDSLNQAYIRTFENGATQEMRFGINGNNEVFRMTPGQMNSYGRILAINSTGDASGFIEPFEGAGRQVFRIGAGPTSDAGQAIFLQLIGPSDTSPEQFAFRYSDAQQPFAGTIDRSVYTDMTRGQTAPGLGTFRNISHSTSAPAGGIIGDVHLVI